jgi:hypothetical protein
MAASAAVPGQLSARRAAPVTREAYVPRPPFARIAVALAAAAIALATADPAGAATPTGVDVSYPQCGTTLPAGKPFAVVGVNGGLANNYNSCLADPVAVRAGVLGWDSAGSRPGVHQHR